MAKSLLTLLAATLLFCGVARADVPAVATDIAPVHSLVAKVMGDLGTPELILPPGASPHGYSLRPSEARALAQADLVFWVGADLTPWLGGAIETLATGARVTELLEAPETRALEFRENPVFGEDADHDDHESGDADADHAHHGHDPHAWLDPQNAAEWVAIIADALAEADPENANVYFANRDSAQVQLEQLTADVMARLAPISGLPYVVFHDAFQYFEVRFDVVSRGAISLGDATDPGAARVTAVRDLVREMNIACIAAEPQFNPALVKTVAGGANIRATVLDPIGTDLVPGEGLYEALIEGLAEGLLACQ